MPTYEYQCPEGHVFEKFQKMTDKPRAKCPTCGKAATRKISGGAALVFKGTGFYITDYGKDGKKSQTPPPAANKGEPKSSESKSTSESKSGSEPKAAETKPAVKPESKPSGKSKSGE